MRRYRSLIYSATLLAAAVPLAWASAVAPSKAESIENVLKHVKTDAPAAEILGRAEKACALTGMDVTQDGSETILRLHTTGTPGATVFAMEKGRKVVVDLSGTVNLDAQPERKLASAGLVTGCRTSQFTLEPEFVTRVVLDVDAACDSSVEQSATQTKVVLTPRAKAAKSEILAQNTVAPVQAAKPLAEHLRAMQTPATATVDTDPQALNQHLKNLSAEGRPAPAPAAAALAQDLKAVAQSDIDLFTFRGYAAAAMETTPAEVAAQTNAETAAQAEALDQAAGETPAEPAAEAPATDAPAAEAPAAEAPAEPQPPMPREAAPEPVDTTAANADLRSKIVELEAAEDTSEKMAAVEAPSRPEPKPYVGDPMEQIVNIDFREMELSNVVALLAHKAGINVIAGTELTGIVTANLRNVTLRRAMETALRMNDLGMLEEEGIYRIVPYGEAMSSKRDSEVIELKNAKSDEMQRVLKEIIVGSPDEALINIASDKASNVVVISGPASKIETLVAMAQRLDVAEPVLPTVTEAIKLNYADPAQILTSVEKMLTEKVGNASTDLRARHIIITDLPVVVENIRELVSKLDTPTKQVAIDAMIVDVNLQDGAETGVDWLINSVQEQSRRQAALGTDENGDPLGRAIGSLQELGLATALTGNPAAGVLNFGILTGDIDWQGIIQAEIRNQKGRLISNPVLVTIENEPATIDITQEIPFVEVKETNAGGSQTNTEFKNIGTVLTVTPRVTHDDDILVDIDAKESTTAGEFNGIPIEDKRSIKTNLRVASGNTIFIGGLRKQSSNNTTRKIPVLGDIPVLNVLFRQNSRSERVNELLIFLACNVVKDKTELSSYQKERLSQVKELEVHVDAQGDLFHDMVYPAQENDPLWKWRRSN